MSELDPPVSVVLRARPRHPWRRRLFWGSLVLVLALGALLGKIVYQYYAEEWALQEALADADRLDPGWRIEELEARRADVPDAENGAWQVLTASRALPGGWLARLGASPQTGLEDGFSNVFPAVPLNDEQVAALRKALQPAGAALTAARRLAELPTGRYAVAWQPDYVSTGLMHIQEVHTTLMLLQLAAALRAQEGEVDDALLLGQALLHTGSSLGDEPFLISQLVRVAAQIRAVRSIERTLAQGEASTAVLEKLQAAVAHEAAQPVFLVGVRAQRAGSHAFLGVLRARRFNRASWGLKTPVLVPEAAINVVEAAKARASHAPYFRYWNALVELAKAPPNDQEAALLALEVPDITLPWIMTMLGETTAPQTGLQFLKGQAVLRCAGAALAAERYRQRHHTWPESLQALVPDYLPAVPIDPFGGAALEFRRLEDGVLISSRGAVDQRKGPLTAPAGSAADPQHVGFRLWDAARRRQAP